MPPQASSSSSSTAAEKAISTLRARLCSEDPFPHASTTSPSKHNDIYKHLRSIFSASSPTRSETINNLAETFARSGEESYKSAITALKAVHESIATEITSFHAQSTSALSETTSLYGNITFPLAATLCHSKNFPKATIGNHLCVLQESIAAAKDELGGLNAEWAACVEEERRIIMAEESEGVESTKMEEAFGKEIDDIVRAKTDDVEKMEKEYRDLLWKESNKMMQAMLAG